MRLDSGPPESEFDHGDTSPGNNKIKKMNICFSGDLENFFIKSRTLLCFTSTPNALGTSLKCAHQN